MVKKIVLCIALTIGVFSQDAYERNCVECHKDLQGLTMTRIISIKMQCNKSLNDLCEIQYKRSTKC
ncbi:MAG: hypothetical protein B6D54_04485 [Epsilonproteobacteria bacterium 4484_65]|nr:MAG: hypothetical protein B6D54_04485 [Epsilonproteobacteria bacterium 4484_65]